jgi:CRP-like cAMP-binding protein
MTTSPLLISNHPFVADMDERHAHVLLHGAVERQLQPGQIIFREGEPANCFYLIESGEIVVELKSGNRAVHIDTLGAGDVLGWSWLFPPFAWHFQARVVQPTHAICCDGAHLLVVSQEDHEFGYELMTRISRVVIQRLQSTRQRLAQLDSIVPAANVAIRR